MLLTTTLDQTTGEAMETLAVVIPSLNEERSTGKVIDNVRVANLLKNHIENFVYVIDRQSTHHTREVAVEKGVKIILEQRKGKGSAIQTLASLKDGVKIGLFLCKRRLQLVNSDRGTDVGVLSIE